MLAKATDVGRSSTRPSFRGPECDRCEIVREADHRIANHLTLLAAFVRSQAADLARRPAALSAANVQMVLDAISTQIIAVGRLHRSLSSKVSLAQDLAEVLHEICASLAALCDTAEIAANSSEGCVVQPDQVLPLTQIVSEVLINAVKYAQPTTGRTLIEAGCSRDETGRIRVEITDNGRGLPVGFDPERDGGLGFRLIRDFARQLQARVEFRSTTTGLRFRLTLPSATKARS